VPGPEGTWAVEASWTTGAVTSPSVAAGRQCEGIGGSITTGDIFDSLVGESCYTGSWDTDYVDYGETFCLSFFPIATCLGSSAGAFNPGTSSGIWQNQSVLNGPVPECWWPRDYTNDKGGSTGDEWNATYFQLC
jgi:hypothetical protein